MLRCKNCGGQVAEDEKFCKNCGAENAGYAAPDMSDEAWEKAAGDASASDGDRSGSEHHHHRADGSPHHSSSHYHSGSSSGHRSRRHRRRRIRRILIAVGALFIAVFAFIIGGDIYQKVGDSVFAWADKPTDIEEYDYKVDYYENSLILAYYKGESSRVWVADNYTIDEVTYPVTSIDGVFSGKSNIKSIIFSEGIEDISYDEFKGCPALEDVYLPSTIKSLGGSDANLFDYAGDHLKNVYYGGTAEQWAGLTAEIDASNLRYIHVYCNAAVGKKFIVKTDITGETYKWTE